MLAPPPALVNKLRRADQTLSATLQTGVCLGSWMGLLRWLFRVLFSRREKIVGFHLLACLLSSERPSWTPSALWLLHQKLNHVLASNLHVRVLFSNVDNHFF